MKPEIESGGIFIPMDGCDLANLLSRFDYVSDDEYAEVFRAMVRNFSAKKVSVRHALVKHVLARHLAGSLLDEVLVLLNGADERFA